MTFRDEGVFALAAYLPEWTFQLVRFSSGTPGEVMGRAQVDRYWDYDYQAALSSWPEPLSTNTSLRHVPCPLHMTLSAVVSTALQRFSTLHAPFGQQSTLSSPLVAPRLRTCDRSRSGVAPCAPASTPDVTSLVPHADYTRSPAELAPSWPLSHPADTHLVVYIRNAVGCPTLPSSTHSHTTPQRTGRPGSR